ncbi:MAG TPA: type II toxin-antitoxin system VapC family toxin [Candidatus Aminicenantes bacterium]|nr:type II toxin-antitoxin system VapC family toxin [Candidatus Aminicenantes bacterium]
MNPSPASARTLSSVPAGAWVAIDTNILVYANQRRSPECIGFLGRCASGELQGVVPAPMAAELAHALMLIEARENNWIDRANPARALGGRPDLVRRLTRCEIQMREFFGIGLRIEPAGEGDILEALRIQKEAGLLVNDALLLATARRLNCEAVASADRAVASAPGFDVYAPADL